MTYGTLRRELTQLCPTARLDQLDGWIRDRYDEILDSIEWVRRRDETTLTFPAEYNTGTVAITNGGTTVTGTGTTWTAAMTGRIFRITGQNDFYVFTYVSSTSGTLDRAFAGDTETEATYRINARVASLPADCRRIETARLIDPAWALESHTEHEIADRDPALVWYGYPQWIAWSYDNASNPPAPQVVIWPMPVDACSIVVPYIAESTLTPGSSQTLLPWMRPAALKAGVQADYARLTGNLPVAESYENRFRSLVLEMIRVDINRNPPQPMRMNTRFTQHRADRLAR